MLKYLSSVTQQPLWMLHGSYPCWMSWTVGREEGSLKKQTKTLSWKHGFCNQERQFLHPTPAIWTFKCREIWKQLRLEFPFSLLKQDMTWLINSLSINWHSFIKGMLQLWWTPGVVEHLTLLIGLYVFRVKRLGKRTLITLCVHYSCNINLKLYAQRNTSSILRKVKILRGIPLIPQLHDSMEEMIGWW